MNIDINNYKNIFMSGIGGISMSGIAVILKKWNYKVSGSDAVSSKQTEFLKQNGIQVFIGQKKENISDDIDLFVYSAAIKENNPEFVRARELNIPCVERGMFLGEITKLFKKNIGIAGTHGKTSTTSMVASAFLEAGFDPSIQVGAVLNRINGNYRVGQSDYFIIEACEYSDSYLNFKQESAIVLNIDNDHLDYFKNIDNIEKSFQKYVSHLPKNGFLVTNNDDERCRRLKEFTKAKFITVGSDNTANWYYDDVTFNEDGYPTFKVYKDNEFMGEINLHVTGIHNVFNATCCIALSYQYGISPDIVNDALKTFTGASRRLEYICDFNGAKLYDDYGHHPTEIDATVKGILNKKFNESWVVFEPHTFSRLSQHLKSFAESLSKFDHIIIIDIYAAREANTFNIHESDLINELKYLNKHAIHISNHDEVIKYLYDNVSNNDIVLTLGAGNVTKIANKIKEMNS